MSQDASGGCVGRLIMMVVVVVALLAVSARGFSTSAALTRVGGARVLLHGLGATEKTFFEEEWAVEAMESMQRSGHAWTRKNQMAEVQAMYDAEVQHGDNYFTGTLGNTRRARLAAVEAEDADSKLAVDDNYFRLMNMGFSRRLAAEKSSRRGARDGDMSVMGSGSGSFLKESAIRTAAAFDVGRSKQQQLQAMQDTRNSRRPGLYKFVPEVLHKYLDYLATLKKLPSLRERNRAYFLGIFFSFVVCLNASARSSTMYYVIGNLALMSALLSRGQPSMEQKPGQPRRQPASWSKQSFKSALAIQLLASVPASLAVLLVTALVPALRNSATLASMRLKAAMTAGLASAAILTPQYEVFETKAKAGSRWRKAMGDIQAVHEQELSDQIDQHRKEETYDFVYDPHVDDYPPVPKYIGETESTMPGGAQELDEDEQQQDFVQWKEERKNSRKAPVEHVEPEEPWVGSKRGMYVDKVPEWLGDAYERNVLNANQWRGKPSVFNKDFSEFSVEVAGPVGFRDKRPEWMGAFGTGVWEEKTQQSRKAARAFGTYRKTMHKLDPEVVLQKCDDAAK